MKRSNGVVLFMAIFLGLGAIGTLILVRRMSRTSKEVDDLAC